MIDGLRPYPEMALPEANWLPGLPRHWELHRAKANFREVDERSVRGDEELLSVSHKTGVTPRSQKNVTMFMAESYEGHKTCQPGDIVVNTLWAWMAALGASKHVGIVSPAYGVYRQRDASVFDSRYLDYLLRTETYRGEYLRSSRGITTSRLRLYPPDFLNILFIQPPLDEQQLIVRFLDWHGALTGKLIRAKRRLIALLNEQKQSIIHRAVTRGLDPAAKLKPSGVDWLGAVPAHWEVRKLRSLFGRLGSGTTPSGDAYYGGEIPWVASGDLNNGVVTQTQKTVTKKAIDEVSSLRIYPANSVLVAMYGATIGKTGILAMDACTNQACFVMADPCSDFRASFCQLVLNAAKPALVEQSYGGGQPNINAEIVKSLKVPFPPDGEQFEIETLVESELGKLNNAIGVADNEIALIQEFRTRLIADVVTGQLDVRTVAAGLPEAIEADATGDLTDEDDLDDDTDALIDEEEAA